MRRLKPPRSHKHRLALAAPIVACLAFGSSAFFSDAPLTDPKPFSSAQALAVALLSIGILSATGGVAFGIALALRRKQPGWLVVSVACLLSVALLALAGPHGSWR